MTKVRVSLSEFTIMYITSLYIVNHPLAPEVDIYYFGTLKDAIREFGTKSSFFIPEVSEEGIVLVKPKGLLN